MTVHDANRSEFTYGLALNMLVRDGKTPPGLHTILAGLCIELGVMDKGIPNTDMLKAAMAAAVEAQLSQLRPEGTDS